MVEMNDHFRKENNFEKNIISLANRINNHEHKRE